AGPLPLHILRNLGVRVVDDLAELRQHRAAPIGRLRNQLVDRSRSCHVSATLLRLSGLGRAGGPRGGRYRIAACGNRSQKTSVPETSAFRGGASAVPAPTPMKSK